MVNREQRILLLLISSEGPMTSAEIALRLGVSSRTVMSCMNLVARELERHGGRLVSRRNWGYAICVTDRLRFEEFRSELDMQAMPVEVAGFDETARFLYIARRLISSIDGVLIDTIAEELSVSRSSLRIPLRRAYDFLESYHIRVIPVPGKGIMLSGEEYQLRLAMTELLAAHFHKASVLDADAGYAGLIACDALERQDIRHAYLEVQRASGLVLRDSRTQRIAMMLIIARNRVRQGATITLPSLWMDELRETAQFACAAKVIARLRHDFEGFDLSEEEQAFIAMYMLCSAPLDVNAPSACLPPRSERDLEKMCSVAFERSESWLGEELSASPVYRHLLQQALIPLCVSRSYGFDGYECFEHENEDQVRQSPVCMALGLRLASLVEELACCRVSHSELMLLASVAMNSLVSCEYELTPLRLLVTDGMGVELARRKGELLARAFPELVASVRSCELYEIRAFETTEYDAIITDCQEVSYNYAYPMAHMRAIDWEEGLAAIHDTVLLDAYNLDELLIARERMSWRTIPRVRSMDRVFGALHLTSARREKLGMEWGRCPGGESDKVWVLAEIVDTMEEERLDLLRFHPSASAERDVIYMAVSPQGDGRRVKAAERLAFQLQKGVPRGFIDDMWGSCLGLLRRSLYMSHKTGSSGVCVG